MNPKQFITTKAKDFTARVLGTADSRMDLVEFTLHTNPSLLFVLAVFVYGVMQLVVDSEYIAALCVFLFGTCIVLAYLLGSALHRHRLVKDKLTAYVRRIIHNANEGLPSEQVAVDYCAYINEHPIE